MRCFDRVLDPLDYEAGIREMLRVLQPDWKPDAMKLQKFTGLTNTLVGCCHDGDRDGMVLFRMYGDGTDLFIDRDAEKRNMQMMHRAGCARPLLASFRNGLVYGYQPGRTVTKETVRAPEVFPLVAAAMARMHRIRAAGATPPSVCLWASLDKMMELAPSSFDDPQQQQRYLSALRGPAELRAELKELRAEVEALDSPVVFCHNDGLLDNVLVTPDGRACLIDFEYGGFNHQAYDIGNHFNEYAGTEDVDYSLFPGRELQLQWLRCYLTAYLNTSLSEAPQPTGQAVQPSDEQVERLYVQTNKFSLLSHFYWGVWALVQTRFSKIDFDYLEYAIIRFSEYDRRRAALATL
ncbi:ethanolamine kinase 2-like [Pollicipes pollicipes]|uniref:ethanolamine kinase 2-like n=1 Tax=Pollicipes pollicipes TaxID=41117 RepID=UPI00188581A4|nr:ethanolamine kinase 2-like [Pollicipes pollicipes]XP_037086535.1 ethanolamine kinase 2-like [Pollicipes pollicipes]